MAMRKKMDMLVLGIAGKKQEDPCTCPIKKVPVEVLMHVVKAVREVDAASGVRIVPQWGRSGMQDMGHWRS